MSFDKGLLIKGDLLPEGYLDFRIGNPIAINQILQETLSKHGYDNLFNLDVSKLGEYPPTEGAHYLTGFLEDRHGAPVVITPGAKYGLFSLMTIARNTGSAGIICKNPYWISMPRLATDTGLVWRNIEESVEGDMELVVSPNNPDGSLVHKFDMIEFSNTSYRPLSFKVHDAAYHTPIYLPENIDWKAPYADYQVFSMGKMWGLAGLRVGYVVCHNQEFYKELQEEMELFCSGVSIASQRIAFDLEIAMCTHTEMRDEFIFNCRKHFKQARLLLSQIKPSVIANGNDIIYQNGMFAWIKKGPLFDIQSLKIAGVGGEHFGASSEFIRLNLAVPMSQIEDLIERLVKLES